MKKKRLSMETLSPESRIVVYCFGVLSDLKRKGFTVTLPWEISATGQHIYNEMVEFEYEPTDEEVRWGMNQIMLAAQNVQEEGEDRAGEEWKLDK